MDEVSIRRAVIKLAKMIMEQNPTAKNLVLVGIKSNGEYLAKRLSECIKEGYGKKIAWCGLDVTYFKEEVNSRIISMDTLVVNVVNKTVIIVDDTIFSGRTAQAAITAVLYNGRPKTIRLAVLGDCGHREVPIQADYVGKNIPLNKGEKVTVKFSEEESAVFVR